MVNHGKVDTSHVSSRLTDCLAKIEERQRQVLRVGDRVSVKTGGKKHQGILRFIGQVDFVDDDEK